MSSRTCATASAPTPSWTGSDGSCSSRAEPAAGRVGRDGCLRLRFERRAGRTVLTGRRFTLPLQALAPMDLDGSGGLALLLLNPTGGVLGGDRLVTEVHVGPGAHVVLGTPSATRVYRAAGPPADVRFDATVAAGGVLEHVPDHVIPSPGARLRQRTTLRLAAGATALVLDAWCTGRPARDEAFRFAELDLALLASDERGPLLIERARLAGDARWGRLGGAEGRPYVATFAALAPARAAWGALAAELAAGLDAVAARAPGLLAGVTPLARGGLLARILAPSAPALEAASRTAWDLCRARLLDRPPLSLRRL